MSKIKFTWLEENNFITKHPDAYSDLGGVPDGLLGEVEVPGHGWCPALLRSSFGAPGEPFMFYTDDDGWQDTPEFAEYEQLPCLSACSSARKVAKDHLLKKLNSMKAFHDEQSKNEAWDPAVRELQKVRSETVAGIIAVVTALEEVE